MIETEAEKKERKRQMTEFKDDNYHRRVCEMNQEIAQTCEVADLFNEENIDSLLDFEVIGIVAEGIDWVRPDVAAFAESTYDNKVWNFSWIDESVDEHFQINVKAAGLEVIRAHCAEVFDPDYRPRAFWKLLESKAAVIADILGEAVIEYIRSGSFEPEQKPLSENREDIYEKFVEFFSRDDLFFECHPNVVVYTEDDEDFWRQDDVF